MWVLFYYCYIIFEIAKIRFFFDIAKSFFLGQGEWVDLRGWRKSLIGLMDMDNYYGYHGHPLPYIIKAEGHMSLRLIGLFHEKVISL